MPTGTPDPHPTGLRPATFSQWEKDKVKRSDSPAPIATASPAVALGLACGMAGARTAFARSQRRGSGLAERRVWDFLRGGKIDGHRFRRQHPVGAYFADFACDRLRLIIEIDGGVHQLDEVVLRDHLRQTELEAMGWTVIRFTNAASLEYPDRIVSAVRSHAASFNT